MTVIRTDAARAGEDRGYDPSEAYRRKFRGYGLPGCQTAQGQVALAGFNIVHFDGSRVGNPAIAEHD